MARRTSSISGPIIWASSSVALTAALLVGWVYVILKNQELTQHWVGNLWLLVAGIVSFLAIMTVLVLFAVFLARQILEVRRQTTFIDSVTHELRSPLASIRLGLETIGRAELPDSTREQLRQMMLDDVERLTAFIDDILEATRVEHLHPSASRPLDDIPLRAFTSRMAHAVARRHKLDPDDIRIEMNDALQIRTDALALEIILKNILDNAVKYSNPPVDVHVRAQPSGTRVLIEVEDQGVGIPKRQQSRIFDRFFRVEHEDVRSRRGTGLGLYVVRALVRSLGGRLAAHSLGQGHGTRMSIELPANRRRARRKLDELLRRDTSEPSHGSEREEAEP